MTDIDESPRIAEVEADNRRLRRLLDQRDAPGELRHRLQSTLAMLRIIIRKSSETERDLEGFVGHLQDRLDAIARAQAAADSRGSIELYDLLADELLHYGAMADDRAVLSGPTVHLQPRAGQVLALAIHELAVNAVEHGVIGAGAGKIHIRWSVAPGEDAPALTLVWDERGTGDIGAATHQGFGTEVLTRTLAYELRAVTTLVFKPDGVVCTIRFPLTDKSGWMEEP